METNLNNKINQALQNKKTMWKLRMKSRIKSKFLFFAIPIALMTFWLTLFGSEEQKKELFPYVVVAMLALVVFNFRKAEKNNIIITKQKEELDEQKKLLEQQKILVD